MRRLYKKHVRGTAKDQSIPYERSYLCNLKNGPLKASGLPSKKIYISSFAVKHMYDKRITFEFETVLDNIHALLKYPDRVCENKPGSKKRGDVALIKKIHDHHFVCLLENDEKMGDISVVTVHIIKPDDVPKFKTLWVANTDIIEERAEEAVVTT
jgi:hypothetical protein